MTARRKIEGRVSDETAAAGAQPAPIAAASAEKTPTRGGEDMLCTLCGLRACWTGS